MKHIGLCPTPGLGGTFRSSIAAVLVLSQWLASYAEDIAAHQGLAVGTGGRGGRSPVHTDTVEAEIISGKWQRPAAGDQVSLPDSASRQWRPIAADNKGWFEDEALQGGYAFVPVTVENNCVMLLEAAGDDLAYVNGEPRAGDPYQYGYVHLPVTLRAGTNDLLFRCGRGRLKVALSTPAAPATLDLADQTLPDMIAGERAETWGAVVVVNATPESRNDLVIRSAIAGQRATETSVPNIPPLSARKVGFRCAENRLSLATAPRWDSRC